MSILRTIKERLFGRARASNDGVGPDEAAPEDELESLHDRARAKIELLQWRSAIVDLDQLLDQNPTNGAAYFDRGTCHLHVEDARAALGDLSRAISLVPHATMRAFAYLGRSSAHELLGELHAALDDAEAANRLLPEAYEIKQQLARLQSRVRDVDDN